MNRTEESFALYEKENYVLRFLTFMLVAVLSWHGTAVEIWFDLDEVVVSSAKAIFILEADLAWFSAFIGSVFPSTNP